MAHQLASCLWTGLLFASFLTSQGFRGQLVQVAEGAGVLAVLCECASSACKASWSHAKEHSQTVAKEQSGTAIKHTLESCMDWGKKKLGAHDIHVVIENGLKGTRDTVTVQSVDLERGSTGDSHDVFGEDVSPGGNFQFISKGQRGLGVKGTVRVRSKREGHYWIIKFVQGGDGSVHASAGYNFAPSGWPTGTLNPGIGKTGENKVIVNLAVVADAAAYQEPQVTANWGRVVTDALRK